ncbi:WbqC family protein [Candidatus Margulisiibacteriota bacterium]
MKAVIMQPTYLPWMGYFDLMDQSDIFIFLDDVQFEKQSWQQRNKIKTAQGELWLTVPVIRKFPQLINEVEVNNALNWSKKHWKTISQCYRKASCFQNYETEFAAVYASSWHKLIDLNISIIKIICRLLGIEKRIVCSSDMNVNGKKVSKIISLCKEVKADIYLSPSGAENYLEEDNQFLSEGIKLEYHNYDVPAYNQLYNDFKPHFISSF